MFNRECSIELERSTVLNKVFDRLIELECSKVLNKVFDRLFLKRRIGCVTSHAIDQLGLAHETTDQLS